MSSASVGQNPVLDMAAAGGNSGAELAIDDRMQEHVQDGHDGDDDDIEEEEENVRTSSVTPELGVAPAPPAAPKRSPPSSMESGQLPGQLAGNLSGNLSPSNFSRPSIKDDTS